MVVIAAFPLKVQRFKLTRFEVEDYSSYQRLVGLVPENVFQKRAAAIQDLTVKGFPSPMIPHFLWWITMIVLSTVSVVAGIAVIRGQSFYLELALLVIPVVLISATVAIRKRRPARLRKWKTDMTSLLDSFTREDNSRHSVRWTLFQNPDEAIVPSFMAMSAIYKGWTVHIHETDGDVDTLPVYTRGTIHSTTEPPEYSSGQHSRTSSSESSRGHRGSVVSEPEVMINREDDPPDYEHQAAETPQMAEILRQTSALVVNADPAEMT